MQSRQFFLFLCLGLSVSATSCKRSTAPKKPKAQTSPASTVNRIDIDDQREADVVFVHGLGGDWKTTWQRANEADSYWPKWLAEDLPQLGVWSVNYEAAPSDWLGRTMPLEDRATNILHRLEAEGIGKDRPVLFIAHSLGGLVVKQALQQAMTHQNPEWKPIGRNTRGVVFLATPHIGAEAADLAIYLDMLAKVFRFTVSIEDLKANGPALRSLNVWYRNNVVAPQVEHKVYFEKHGIGGLPLVMNEGSADFGSQGVFPIPVDADHMSICKLESREDLIYKQVRAFLVHRLSGGDVTRSDLLDLSSGQAPAHLGCIEKILFDELGPLSPVNHQEVETVRAARNYRSPDVDRFAYQSEPLSKFATPPVVNVPAGIEAKIMIYVLDEGDTGCRIVSDPESFHAGGPLQFDVKDVHGKVRLIYFVYPLTKAAYDYFRGNGLKHVLEKGEVP